ncbi:hypothetical protein PTKIN_Ptkin10aG0106200 [Pterospermum kingtungense]
MDIDTSNYLVPPQRGVDEQRPKEIVARVKLLDVRIGKCWWPTYNEALLLERWIFLTLGASALCGSGLPAIELTYKKAKQTTTYSLVMEMQMIMSFSATFFCTMLMLFHKDFEAIPTGASEFERGQSTCYIELLLNAI